VVCLWGLALSELCLLSVNGYYVKCVPSAMYTAGNGKWYRLF